MRERGSPVDVPAISFPALALSSGNSMFLVETAVDVKRLAVCTRLALIKGYYERLALWDAAGIVWRIRATPARPITVLGKFLARTVYNPATLVHLAFDEGRPFKLDELKAELRELVRRDDDVLTQFVSRERLTKIIDVAESFARLVGTLQKHRVVYPIPTR